MRYNRSTTFVLAVLLVGIYTISSVVAADFVLHERLLSDNYSLIWGFPSSEDV